MYELSEKDIIKVKDFFYVRYNELEKNLDDFYDLIKQNYSTTASKHSLDEFHYLQSIQKWIELESRDIENDGGIRLEYWLQYFCTQVFTSDGVNKKIALAKAKILFKLGLEVLGLKQKELIKSAFITKEMFNFVMQHNITIFF